jgi:hypothetical protein
MMFRYPFLATLLAVVLACSTLPSMASSQSDAIRSADFAARTSVQTVYHNLVTRGYPWQWIRDSKLPRIMMRATKAIAREASAMDRDLLINHYIPAYVTSFYDEIDKLNAQNQVECMDTIFIADTLIPFLGDLRDALRDVANLLELRAPILRADYSYRTCQTMSSCQKQMNANYYLTFEEQLGDDAFYKVCRRDTSDNSSTFGSWW